MTARLGNFAAFLVVAGCLALAASAQRRAFSANSGTAGAQMAAGIMASASDGAARYLAPDGPIQPAITAIGGLPLRGFEQINNGISSISNGFNRGAQRMAQAAGQNGQIRMPGMDTAASMMPASFAQAGNRLQGMIRAKNNFIRGQAERGVDAANRMGQKMHSDMQASASGPMESLGHTMSQGQQMISKSGQELKSQLQQTLQGSMSRLQGMQGVGTDLRNQATGYARTLSKGIQGAAGQLSNTGRELMSQMQQNHNKNMSGMTGLLSSLQGSMDQMGKNMQKNLSGLQQQASNVAQQLTSSVQSAIQAPMNLLQNGLKMGSNGSGRY